MIADITCRTIWFMTDILKRWRACLTKPRSLLMQSAPYHFQHNFLYSYQRRWFKPRIDFVRIDTNVIFSRKAINIGSWRRSLGLHKKRSTRNQRPGKTSPKNPLVIIRSLWWKFRKKTNWDKFSNSRNRRRRRSSTSSHKSFY